jgi:type IV pilus assembly protein PilC
MTSFSYVATDDKQNVVKGSLDQPDKSSAIAAINKLGLRPISLKESNTVANVAKFNLTIGGGNAKGKVKSAKLVIFTRQLSAMVGAGVPLLRALSSLAQHTDSKTLSAVIGDVITGIESGSTFADALGKHSNVFDEIYVNMVRAGETAGILDDILKRLAIQQEKNATIKKKIKSAMIYPITLMIVTVIAFFGLMLFVVPQLGKILADIGGEDAKLPGITLFMLAISNFITTNWYIVIIVLVGGIFGWVQFVKTAIGRHFWDTVLINLPGIKTVAIKMSIARFTRTFSALMGAGVNVLECLRVSSKSVGNVLYQEALESAAVEVKNGRQLSAIIMQNKIFPSIVGQMLAVGEETGQTDTVLIKVADFYEEEVDVAVSGLSSIIEPVMIVIMGGAVGLIAASVMLPIASLTQNIQ